MISGFRITSLQIFCDRPHIWPGLRSDLMTTADRSLCPEQTVREYFGTYERSLDVSK